MPEVTSEQLKSDLERMVAEIRGGREVALTLGTSLFGGQPFVRATYVRYGDHGRVLKPEPALPAVIVGPHVETLRMLADVIERG